MPGPARVRRWDLFWVSFDPVVGSEQGGAGRPAVIVSNDGFNATFPVVTVIPVTGTRGKRRRAYPFEVHMPRQLAGNPEDSIAMPRQIRTISKTRLGTRIGALRDPDLRARIEARLLEHLGIDIGLPPANRTPKFPAVGA